jgi:hypothetical protein
LFDLLFGGCPLRLQCRTSSYSTFCVETGARGHSNGSNTKHACATAMPHQKRHNTMHSNFLYVSQKQVDSKVSNKTPSGEYVGLLQTFLKLLLVYSRCSRVVSLPCYLSLTATSATTMTTAVDATVEQSAVDTSTPPQPITFFPQFAVLPAELRLNIWTHLLPPPQPFQLDFPPSGDAGTRVPICPNSQPHNAASPYVQCALKHMRRVACRRHRSLQSLSRGRRIPGTWQKRSRNPYI